MHNAFWSRKDWARLNSKHNVLMKIIIIREFFPTLFEFLVRNNPGGWFSIKDRLQNNMDSSKINFITKYGQNYEEYFNDELLILIYRITHSCARDAEYNIIYQQDEGDDSKESSYSDMILDLIHIVNRF
jgi:hypothetical protein